MTSRFFSEILDLAQEQRWSARRKDAGWLFHPPRAIARPGFEQVFASDPGKDSHSQKVVRDRMRKAGLKFDDDQEAPIVSTTPSKPNGASGHAPASSASVQSPQPANLFAAVRQKVNVAINALSDAEGLLAQIESDTAEMTRLRELLKSTLIK